MTFRHRIIVGTLIAAGAAGIVVPLALSFSAALAPMLTASPIMAEQPRFDLCPAGERRTEATVCVWDGDTVVLYGERIRLEGIDTPERTGYDCNAELELAMEATYRLQEILNSHEWELVRSGQDRYQRTLGHFRIGETTAGQMLMDEGLAREWPDGERFWCE